MICTAFYKAATFICSAAATLLSGAVAADRLQYRTEFSSRKNFRLSEVETEPKNEVRSSTAHRTTAGGRAVRPLGTGPKGSISPTRLPQKPADHLFERITKL